MPTTTGRIRGFVANWRERNVELADNDELGKMAVLIRQHREKLKADAYARIILKRFDAETSRRGLHFIS